MLIIILIREMQIKITSNPLDGYNQKDSRYGWRCGEIRPLYTVGGNVKPLRKTIWQFLKKLNLHLKYDPAIQPQSVYPKEMKA